MLKNQRRFACMPLLFCEEIFGILLSIVSHGKVKVFIKLFFTGNTRENKSVYFDFHSVPVLETYLPSNLCSATWIVDLECKMKRSEDIYIYIYICICRNGSSLSSNVSIFHIPYPYTIEWCATKHLFWWKTHIVLHTTRQKIGLKKKE